jgi:hypothetical protein
MTQAADVFVRQQLIVEAPTEPARAVRTQRFGEFNPPEHNSIDVAIAGIVFEDGVAADVRRPLHPDSHPAMIIEDC